MSFEHKYLKYKQKYLDLKKEVSLLKNQLGGAAPLDVSAQDPSANVVPYESLPAPRGDGEKFFDESSLDISALTDTPKVSDQAKQLGGYLMSSETDSENRKLLNSESDHSLDNVDNLTETPKKHDMVVSINSSDESEPSMAEELIDSSENVSDEDDSDNEDIDNEEDSSDKKEISDDDSSDQEGGDLETSISELEEIFSQLGGKKTANKKDDSDSDFDSSSMSSLSSLDSSSSDFDL